MSEVVTMGELSTAIDTLFDRIRDYFPPPVYVGRGKAMMISLLVSAVVLVLVLQPAIRMKNEADGDPAREIMAISVIVGCVIATLLVQRTVAGVIYNFAMYGLNRQHFANTHWITEYKKV